MYAAPHLWTADTTVIPTSAVRMSETLPLLIDRVDTLVGEILIVADREGNLRSVDWADHETSMRRLLHLHYAKMELGSNRHAIRMALAHAISRYFGGELTAIDILPVQTAGTPFQREVWRALRNISCGTSVSYAEVAELTLES